MFSARNINALLLFSALRYLSPTIATTSISTFTDEHCQASYNNLNGPNGYPNGSCTELDSEGPFKSFQVVGEDVGCSVTIYEKDTGDPCSATTIAQFAEIAICYNTSWFYYSIDGCTHPNLIPPSASNSPTHKSTNNKGVIAGGVVGGALGLAIIVGVVAFWIFRRRGQQTQQAGSPQPSQELSDMNTVQEKSGSPKRGEIEGHGECGVAEMATGSMDLSVVELDASRRHEADAAENIQDRVRVEQTGLHEMPGDESWGKQ